MNAQLVIVAALLIGLQESAPYRSTPQRRIQCKTEAVAASCYWTHGRLQYGNGTPALRLWKTGTSRLLGIYSGPSVDVRGDDHGDNEDPELPANLASHPRLARSRVWADFEICPLEPEKPGVMQAASIESAKNVFVEKVR